MILKIAVILGAAVILVKARSESENSENCRPRYKISESKRSNYYQGGLCDVLASEATKQAWYEAEAFLEVRNGTLIVELLSINSRPNSLNANGRGIVRLERSFARISSLEWFSLEDNLIEKIEDFVFESLPRLVYLSLARNRITYIGSRGFQGLTKLQVLNLDHNRLEYKINFNMDQHTLPALTKLYIQHNQLAEINAGDSLVCKSNVKHLYLSNNSIKWFSPEDSCLTHLTHLFLEDNDLTYFQIGQLSLEALSLDGNSLEFVPNVNSQLKFLSLARNRITRIRSLEDAENIVYLILSYNLIDVVDEEQLYPMNFANWLSLEHLELDYNFLKSIPDGFFHNSTSLQSINLAGNEISHISQKAFENLPELRALSLNRNALRSFPGNEPISKSNLVYLDFSNNQVEYISDLHANMIPKLKVLQLTGNPLKRMDPHSVSNDATIFF